MCWAQRLWVMPRYSRAAPRMPVVAEGATMVGLNLIQAAAMRFTKKLKKPAEQECSSCELWGSIDGHSTPPSEHKARETDLARRRTGAAGSMYVLHCTG